jgi:hypothetical protein
VANSSTVRVRSLILIPAAITFGITLLRLMGELLDRSPTWFQRQERALLLHRRARAALRHQVLNRRRGSIGRLGRSVPDVSSEEGGDPRPAASGTSRWSVRRSQVAYLARRPHRRGAVVAEFSGRVCLASMASPRTAMPDAC